MAARLAAKRTIQGLAALVGAPVAATLAYAQYEPGFKRELTFWSMVVPPMAEYWWHDSSEYARLHEKYAPKALAGMLELGGMYIKFGQVCSVRPEFVPKAYREAFRALQSEVDNECSFDDVRGVIHDTLGQPLEDVFSEFDPEPLGRASIGQAHLARLAESGEEVVVKVQYPDARWKFEADIRALKLFVDIVRKEGSKAYREFSRQFLLELNYEAEAQNLQDVYDRVSAHYRGRVVFPQLFPKYCSPLVITMSRVPGEELETEVRRRLAAAGVEHISFGRGMFKGGQGGKGGKGSGTKGVAAGGGRKGGGGGPRAQRHAGEAALQQEAQERRKTVNEILEEEAAAAAATEETEEEEAATEGGEDARDGVGPQQPAVAAGNDAAKDGNDNTRVAAKGGGATTEQQEDPRGVGMLGGMMGGRGDGDGDGEGGGGGAAAAAARRMLSGVGIEPLLRVARVGAWLYSGLVGLALLALQAVSPLLRLVPGPLRRLDDWRVEFAAERRRRQAMSFTGDTIRLLVDVHGFEIFRARIFNADPHPGNIIVTPDQQLGLIDYGQCKRLTLAEARPLARLMLAIHRREDDETVAALMRACGFRSANDDPLFLAGFGRLLFEKMQPHSMDHNWHRELHGRDRFTQFPEFAIMVARVSGILRGVGLTFMHNLGVADLWAVHAQALLDEGDTAVDYDTRSSSE